MFIPFVSRISSHLALLAVTITLVCTAQADGPPPSTTDGPKRPLFPATIPLPDGFQPEGVAVHGLTVVAGSLIDGDIYKASVVTGEGRRLIDAPEGRTAVGLDVNRHGQLFVCGGPLGTVYVYDVESGAPLADYQVAAPQTSLINDVIVTHDAAYFTDSWNPTLYRLPLGPHGELPAAGAAEALPLTGPIADDFLPGEFNNNGIVYDAWTGSLVVVNTAREALYRVDPESGASQRLDLGGETIPAGDGLVLWHRTLYVVQNSLNQIAVVHLSALLDTGRILQTIIDPRLQGPTTAAAAGPYLFAVNGRFDVAPPPLSADAPAADPSIHFDVVRVRAPGSDEALEPPGSCRQE